MSEHSSHLGTIIARIKTFENKFNFDIDILKKEPLFLVAIRNTQEYQAHWNDQTPNEVNEANELWRKYSKYLRPQDRKNAAALKEEWDRAMHEVQ